MSTPLHDVRYAVRMLWQQPSFTAIALLTLTLGIGATTAIFSVVNAVVLRPLPFERSERLIAIYESNLQHGWPRFAVAPANFVDWARESRTFESIAAFSTGTATLFFTNEAQQVPAVIASSELFEVLRGRPLFGRGFNDGDDAPGAPAIAVIGHGLWRRRFGGAPVVGSVVTINDRPTTIVGVMPQEFGRGNPDTDLWLPMTMDRAQALRGGRGLRVLGRLADASTIDAARSEMQAIAEQLARTYPESNLGWSVTLVPLQETVVDSQVRRALMLLLGAVVFVLLIACANVANLLSARGITRQRELAIRAALGAGRLRLLQQLVTESVVLSAIGGALGVFVALWGTRLLLAFAPPSLPRLHEVNVDVRVLAAGFLATFIAALIFGLVPALQAIATRPDQALKETSRGGTSSPVSRRMGHALVVAELGLAVVLLVGAGLLVRSFIRLSSQSLGFRAEQAVVFRLSLPDSRYPSAAAVTQFYRGVLDRIRQLPGVAAAGATHALPFSGMDSVRPFIREGDAISADNAPTSEYRLITPGYFAAMGIPVKRGREFVELDAAGQPGAVIVNESFARRFLPGSDAIGQRIRQAGDNPEIPWMTVVGVVGDVRHFGFAADMRPEMFWPEAQATWGTTLNRTRRTLTVVVRTTGDPLSLLPSIRSQVAGIDPHRPVIDMRPLGDVVSRSADVQRFSMLLMMVFASIGLVLAAAGVYGIMSYSVAARRREMGIRLALGARPREILGQVMRTGVALAAAGAALGLAAAWLLDDVFAILLFQTAPRDTWTFLGVAGLLLGTALFACYRPARRAAQVDPIEALREE